MATTTYVTVSALKTTLNITASTWDTDLTNAITAASRAIDQETGRRFWVDDDANQIRYYTPTYGGAVLIDDLVTLTTVVIDLAGDGSFSTTWTSGTDFDLYPYNAVADSQPYTSLEVRPQSGAYLPCYTRSVKVTGKFGWPAVPGTISEATSILAARLFKRAREAPLSVWGIGADGTPVRISKTDPDVYMLIEPYSRRRLIQ